MVQKKPPAKPDKIPASSWRGLAYGAVKKLADSPLPTFLFISTFILIRWWNNSDFSYPSEVWIPIISFGVLASIVYAVYRLLLGYGLAAHLATLITTYGMYGFQFISDSGPAKTLVGLLPAGWQTEFISSVYLALLVGLVGGLAGWAAGQLVKKSHALQTVQPLKVLLFVIIFIFCLQLVKTADRLADIKGPLFYKHPAIEAKPSRQTSQKPDIYYLVFDRFASNDVLKSNFAYDNSKLMAALAGQGLTNRDPAYSNYPFTMSSLASTLSMEYFPALEKKFGGAEEWQGAFAYRDILNNPPIAQLLKSQGYQYNQIGSWWDFTRVGSRADSHPTRAFVLEAAGRDWYLTDLQRDIINKSVLSPWLKKGPDRLLKYDRTRHPRENFAEQMAALKALSARPDKSTPQFSFAHILAPHPPYEFAADGSDPDYDAEANDNGEDEKIKYINSLTYVSDQLAQLAADIRRHSPEAVIVIQADEGPYPKQFRGTLSAGRYYDPADLSLPDMKQKLGILASYYMPGLDAAKMSELEGSVNVFRFILNNYLGYELPYLPDCHFSTGNKFTIYEYELLPAELTGRPIPTDCEKYD